MYKFDLTYLKRVIFLRIPCTQST